MIPTVETPGESRKKPFMLTVYHNIKCHFSTACALWRRRKEGQMSKMKDMAIRIEELKEDICDNYCKYPEDFRCRYPNSDYAQEIMWQEVCQDCPLNEFSI